MRHTQWPELTQSRLYQGDQRTKGIYNVLNEKEKSTEQKQTLTSSRQHPPHPL